MQSNAKHGMKRGGASAAWIACYAVSALCEVTQVQVQDGPLWERADLNVQRTLSCGDRASRSVPSVELKPTTRFADLAIKNAAPIVLRRS